MRKGCCTRRSRHGDRCRGRVRALRGGRAGVPHQRRSGASRSGAKERKAGGEVERLGPSEGAAGADDGNVAVVPLVGRGAFIALNVWSDDRSGSVAIVLRGIQLAASSSASRRRRRPRSRPRIHDTDRLDDRRVLHRRAVGRRGRDAAPSRKLRVGRGGCCGDEDDDVEVVLRQMITSGRRRCRSLRATRLRAIGGSSRTRATPAGSGASIRSPADQHEIDTMAATRQLAGELQLHLRHARDGERVEHYGEVHGPYKAFSNRLR